MTYLGKSPVPEWLDGDWLLGQFGRQRVRAVQAYMGFVREGGWWDESVVSGAAPGISG